MSLSGGKGKRKGRVSYQLLSINQLGAVYEALLSYRGFFAPKTCTRCSRSPRKAPVPPAMTTPMTMTMTKATETRDEAPAADDRCAGQRLVRARQPHRATTRPARRVHDIDEQGHRKLRMYPRGTFIYRLAGRDRQKSASYYTPQVLTRCLVKYALKELLDRTRPPTTS